MCYYLFICISKIGGSSVILLSESTSKNWNYKSGIKSYSFSGLSIIKTLISKS